MSKQTKLARGRKLGVAGVAAAAAIAAGWATAGPALASQTPTAEIDGTTLTVTGTGDADRIALRLAAADANQLEVDFGDNGSADFTFNRATFNQIVVLTLGGNDEFRVIDAANSNFADEALTVDGGRGDDILNGGRGIETFYGRGGTDTVDGNQGNDSGFLGSGDDSFRWDPGDGSDRVEGERGFDTLDFNGAAGPENMRLSPVGGRSLFFRDAANINMDMDDVERLDLTALGSVDTFILENMSGTDFKVADVDLSGPTPPGGADGAADVVTVNGTARGDEISVDTDGARVTVEGLKVALNLSGSEVADTLQINGLAGDDEVSVADGVAALITPSIDLGADED
jgi:hypothetical protein